MPIKHAIWKVATSSEPLKEVALASEQQLEDMIVARPGILSDEWMLIGRQEHTGLGGRIELLAIAPEVCFIAASIAENEISGSDVAYLNHGRTIPSKQ
jgi:hypothetical protein